MNECFIGCGNRAAVFIGALWGENVGDTPFPGLRDKDDILFYQDPVY
jgi:hypothetical protein